MSFRSDAVPHGGRIHQGEEAEGDFPGAGETDDWAHAGTYAEYLNAAHLGDSYLQALWTMVQAMPEYAGKTTLIVLPTMGAALGAKWTSHGEDIPESAQT